MTNLKLSTIPHDKPTGHGRAARSSVPKLAAYATILAKNAGEAEPPASAKLIAPMLQMFMATNKHAEQQDKACKDPVDRRTLHSFGPPDLSTESKLRL